MPCSLWKTGIEELIAYQKEALYALASEEVLCKIQRRK